MLVSGMNVNTTQLLECMKICKFTLRTNTDVHLSYFYTYNEVLVVSILCSDLWFHKIFHIWYSINKVHWFISYIKSLACLTV